MSFLDNIRFKNIIRSHKIELPISTDELREILSQEFKTPRLGFSLSKEEDQQRYTGKWIAQNHFQLHSIQQIITGKGLLQMLAYRGKIKSLGKTAQVELSVGPSVLLRVLVIIMLMMPLSLLGFVIYSPSIITVICALGFGFVFIWTTSNFLGSFQNTAARAGTIIEWELMKIVKRRG